MINTANAYINHVKKHYKVHKSRNSQHGECLSCYNTQFVYDAQAPIVACDKRKLNYHFMFHEAYLIATGNNSVKDFTRFMKSFVNYSDDGETFFGAYGPKYVSQVDNVVQKLMHDSNTRQAVINIWRENPPATKDTPCTLNLVFYIVNGKLNCTINMRSSDVWLGLPYDIFTFAIMNAGVCARYNALACKSEILSPGINTICAVNSHLYTKFIPQAKELIRHHDINLVPNILYKKQNLWCLQPKVLEEHLLKYAELGSKLWNTEEEQL